MELAEQTSFVGRRWELDELRKLMATFRLVTLTGAGGCGKSRLAYHLVHSVPARNLAVVELATINHPDLLPGAVCRALGLPDSARPNPTRRIVDYLGQEPALLLWDNCEHLADACAALADALLKASDTVQLVCTSRQALKVPGEKAWLVPSLSFPTPDSAVNATDDYESVRLFIDRAEASSPSFRQTQENAAAIVGICARLEGIPLAIELAAARTNVLAPAQILRMLDDALSLLGSDKGFIERHRTLESTLDWSYRLLSDQERVLFGRIGVFAGVFDIDSAMDVCCDADTSPHRLLESLGNLIDRCLVVANTSKAAAEYHMLEPVRQYALRLLNASGDEVRMRRAHLRHYVSLAESAEPHLIAHQEQAAWLDRLDQQLPDIRTALSWAFSNEPEQGAKLATLLGWFWWFRAYLTEGKLWIRRALEASFGRPELMAAAIRFESHLALREGDNRQGAKRALEALNLYRRLGDPSGEAMSLFLVGTAARSLGHFARARVLMGASLRLEEQLGSPLRANVTGDMGVLSLLTGDWRAAIKSFHTAAALQRASGDRWGLALTLANSAELHIHRDECHLAAPLVMESLEIMRSMHDSFTLVQLVDYAGMIAIAGGDTAIGLRMMGGAEAQRRRLQLQQTDASRDLTERWIERAGALIGPGPARNALNQGHDAKFLDLVASAGAALAAAPKPSDGLSRRERQVAQLIGEGITNREIAQRLFISRRTAEGHVVQILNKLGFQRRSQIASWVSRDKPPP